MTPFSWAGLRNKVPSSSREGTTIPSADQILSRSSTLSTFAQATLWVSADEDVRLRRAGSGDGSTDKMCLGKTWFNDLASIALPVKANAPRYGLPVQRCFTSSNRCSTPLRQATLTITADFSGLAGISCKPSLVGPRAGEYAARKIGALDFRGESYRLKDRRKAGLVPPRDQERGAAAVATSLASASVPLKARQKTALGSTASEAKEAHS